MTIIQIILLLFFLFAVVKVVGRYGARDLSFSGMVAWVIFWAMAGLVVLFPDTTFYAARMVGVTRGADLVVYLALALIFFIIFRLMVTVERLNKDLTRVTRELALREANKDKN